MNRILVAQSKPENLDKKTFFVEFSSAADILAILRADHFVQLQIEVPNEINNSQLRFIMQVTRLLTKEVLYI